MEETLEIASKLGAAIANYNGYKMFREAEEQLKKIVWQKKFQRNWRNRAKRFMN